MLNKRIKSLLVAGLLVFSMTGMAFADSTSTGMIPANSISIGSGMYQKEFENGNIILEFTSNPSGCHIPEKCTAVDGNHDNCETYPANTYQIMIRYNTDYFIMSQMKIKAGGTTGTYSQLTDRQETENMDENGVWRKVTLIDTFTGSMEGIELIYNAAEDEEEQPTVSYTENEQKVIDNYKENMEALGTVKDNVRTITKASSIEKSTWDEFVQEFNDKNNGMIIKESAGKYYVYVNIDGEEKLIETIEIEFFDAGNKGWVPGITPGTGQALAVGGIAIGAAAAVGLLVNNRKRKDEE